MERDATVSGPVLDELGFAELMELFGELEAPAVEELTGEYDARLLANPTALRRALWQVTLSNPGALPIDIGYPASTGPKPLGYCSGGWKDASQPSASAGQQRRGRGGAMSVIEPREITLHGRTVSYVQAGNGPVLLLIHGVAGTLENWRPAIGPLARDYTVVASDLPGHGRSATGAGDYSLGAMAAGLRDLLLALGHERATLVGHSLGGGIAMQFSYQFPELTERLVLVSSGGLGTEVSGLLRAATLPGSGLFIACTAAAGTAIGRPVGRVMSAIGRRPSADIAEVARGYGSLVDRNRRAAFLSTLRGVVGSEGQRVHAADRLYLAEGLPVLIVWGARDPIIPVQHAHSAHEAMLGSRLEIFPEAGHLPQIEAPERFVTVLSRFMAETEALPFDPEQWRNRLRPPTQPSNDS